MSFYHEFIAVSVHAALHRMHELRERHEGPSTHPHLPEVPFEAIVFAEAALRAVDPPQQIVHVTMSGHLCPRPAAGSSQYSSLEIKVQPMGEDGLVGEPEHAEEAST